MNGNIQLGVLAAILLGMLAGCSSRDPYARDDVWYPTGAPAANLAAQLANPADLAGGRDDPRQASAASVRAVNRIWADTPKALSDSPAGQSTTGGGPAAAPAGGN